MSTYKSFAVVGGGTVGLPIVNALVAKNVPVSLLSWSGATAKTVPSSVQVVHINFSDAAAVAVGHKNHWWTLQSSQKSNCLCPEYGPPADGYTETEDPLGAKSALAAYLKSVNLPSTRIHTGTFIEFIPWLIGYGNGGRIKVVGKGETPVSFTSITDIAGFVAAAPPSELEDRILRLEGAQSILNGLAPLFGTSVEHVDRLTGETGEFQTALQISMDAGAGSMGWD